MTDLAHRAPDLVPGPPRVPSQEVPEQVRDAMRQCQRPCERQCQRGLLGGHYACTKRAPGVHRQRAQRRGVAQRLRGQLCRAPLTVGAAQGIPDVARFEERPEGGN